MGLGDRVSTILAFLRVGYPTCVPAAGYFPLLALLPRRVSDDEVAEIVSELATRGRPVDNADIGVEITRSIHEMPSLEDIERVRQRLIAIGGPDTPIRDK
ncbi:hypothetical protein AWC29_18915 [Mycobacterium triplex]|uniref:DUF3349 domain-containing protein n=1 Tax=Mycobacterium triplex TaxID=47839 RepID=A0A024JVT5_9MYCO|nr:DUF3349 domain-containing protein [Mycobacterium triplex]ORX03019.1 hypothetical protein AWC29_18915 [Mycobacterium triplex]CDO87477.1 hypothetical protein BN973_01831 [Mycobacterium triplex]